MISKKTSAIAAVSSMLGLWTTMLVCNGALVLGLGFPFKWIWNALLPALFASPQISYLQAAGLLGLVALLRNIILGVKVRADFRM